jgi:hypothetical protein
MQAPGYGGVVRVTHTREEIERATQVGVERKREGYSPEALVLAVDEILNNLQLSRAIVVYVQSMSQAEGQAELERPFSWFSVFGAAVFTGLCLWLVVLLFRQVAPDTGFFMAILIVIAQSILLRLAKGAVRYAFVAACDGLNNASYPTNLHPLRNSSPIVGRIRTRRLRALVVETADRIISGEKPGDIAGELAQVNLTPSAAQLVVGLARIRATMRDYLPPYESRWLALSVACAFLITCVIVIERAGDRLAEGYHNYALAVTAWVGGDIAAKPRRRRLAPNQSEGQE